MKKNTLEEIENSYKEAIRNKFRIERVEGKHSHYLNNPSQALLRDLCWDIFSSNPKTEDLSVYRNFFRAEFKSEEDTSTTYTNKFKKVGGFYKGDKEPANISTVDLAAILVDFHPRPFNKFKKEIDEEEMKLINELRDTNFIPKEVSSNELIEKTDINSFADFTDVNIVPKEISSIELIEKTEIKSFADSNANFTDIKSELESINLIGQTVTEKEAENGMENGIPPSKPQSRLEKIREKILANFWKNFLITTIVVGALFVSIIISASFFKKDCMVWVNDHYEERDRSEGGFCDTYYDERYFDLKKISVCDTTTFFDNNGKPKVWYIRIGNSLEYFDRFAPYPEDTNRYLKPITNYMIKTHIAGKPCK
ncbi:hypothetical protein C8C83_3278 [Flavobacterium sp. 90]|uniref:hypothetical protein n=1 Tax=unclassified Flavobacterium TaxID=196869 RepID=UPI000EB0F6BA|nr:MULTISPECIES: hypothetical protein [unclassified Flavobacterium]RKR11541.1 hypothetical protein C8C82_3589 [Flavobacterium sp. 81]TCK55322.1 hypothetical protein C8C83_3278 [Flavobacterium sp. 90]